MSLFQSERQGSDSPHPLFFVKQKRARLAQRAARSSFMFYIYILQSLKDNKTYVGYTDDFKRRIKQHNLGYVKSTGHRIPFKLLFTEQFETSTEAKKRELYWKSGAGRSKLREYFYRKWIQSKSSL